MLGPSYKSFLKWYERQHRDEWTKEMQKYQEIYVKKWEDILGIFLLFSALAGLLATLGFLLRHDFNYAFISFVNCIVCFASACHLRGRPWQRIRKKKLNDNPHLREKYMQFLKDVAQSTGTLDIKAIIPDLSVDEIDEIGEIAEEIGYVIET